MANEVMLSKHKASSLKALIRTPEYVTQFESVMPKWMNVDRLLRIVSSAANMNPKIADCTPVSILVSVMQCAQLGIEPILGRAYLIPYENTKTIDGQKVKVMECQFQIGYQGLIELAERTGDYDGIKSHVVYKNDKFEIKYGLEEDLMHVPFAGDRGEPIGAYTVWKRTNGAKNFTFMFIRDIYAKHRDRSSGYQSALRTMKRAEKEGWSNYTSKNPWLNVDLPDMLKKSVVKAHSKTEHRSIDFMKAVDLDNMADMGTSQIGAHIPDNFLAPVSEAPYAFFAAKVSEKFGEPFLYIHDELPETGFSTVSAFVNLAATQQKPEPITAETLMSQINSDEIFNKFWTSYRGWAKNFSVSISNSSDKKSAGDKGEKDEAGENDTRFDGIDWQANRMGEPGVKNFWDENKDDWPKASETAQKLFREKWGRVCGKDPFPADAPEKKEDEVNGQEKVDPDLESSESWEALQEAKAFREDLYDKAVAELGYPETEEHCSKIVQWISSAADSE